MSAKVIPLTRNQFFNTKQRYDFMRSFAAIATLLVIFSSCAESDEARQKRIAESESQRKAQAKQDSIQREEEKLEKIRQDSIAKAKEEARRKKQQIRDRYIDNTLRTGSTPYADCYGSNTSCSGRGCSRIKVIAPENSDVMALIKSGKEVVSHAFIHSGGGYTFEMKNGTYQPFFYIGRGWNPKKQLLKASCGNVIGGFIENEHWDKDDPNSLSNQELTYELILQTNGNFSEIPSSKEEALLKNP